MYFKIRFISIYDENNITIKEWFYSLVNFKYMKTEEMLIKSKAKGTEGSAIKKTFDKEAVLV